jgi:hypothetical protein
MWHMNKILLIALVCLHNISVGQVGKSLEKKYLLINTVRKKDERFGPKLYNVSVVNQKDINKLGKPLKALAAYYSGFAGSDCISDDSTHNVICELTTALGLAYQGSEAQISIISKWFPNDKTAKEMIKNNCFVGIPGGSSYGNDYSYLSFAVQQDTVTVEYKFGLYYHGKPTKMHKDIVIIKADKITFIKHGFR